MNKPLLWLLIGFAFCTYAQNKNRALIIGISEYKELPKALQLQYADDDAMEFYKFILSKAIGNIDSADVKLLLNTDATAAQIYSALDELIDVSKANDKIIIYFSGHGDIETKTVRQRGFLLAHDSPKAGYQVGGTVKLSDLQDYLETLVTTNKARVILITDACRSGKLAGGEAGATQTTAALNEQWGSITKILSSQAGELSGESSEWGSGHGVFTYNLINGLWGLADNDKDGWVSLIELNIFLSQEVPKATFDSQHPVISGNLGSKMSRVDKNKVAELIAKSNLNNPDASLLLASNKGAFTNMDTVSKRLYRDFKSAVERGDLLQPKKGNAFDLYKQLSSLNGQNTPFINEMKRVLVANIEDDVQSTLNRYMVHDKSLKESDYHLASEKMDFALSLIPANYSRFNSITAKKLFLKANLLECICDPKAVGDKKAKQSLTVLKKAITLEPDLAYIYNSLGSAYFFLDKYDSAMASYRQANQLAPAWLYPISNLGAAYLAKGTNSTPADIERALELYRKVIQLDSSYSNGYYDMARALFFKSEWASGYYYNALSYYLDGNEKQFWRGLETAVSYGYDVRKSSFFKYHSSLKSDVTLIEMPEYEELLDSYDQEGSQVALWQSNYWLGQGNLKSKQYDKAIENFNKAVESLPLESKSYFGLSEAYAGKKDNARSAYYKAKGLQQEYDTDKAAEYYQLAISKNPNAVEFYMALGDMYEENGSTDEAIETYTKAVSANPNWAVGFIRLGKLYYDDGENEKAATNYEHAVALDPKLVEGYKRLGEYYSDAKQFDRAIENFEKALHLDSLWSDGFIGLGDLYNGKMKYDKAQKNLQRAIDLDSTSSEAFVKLAEFYTSQKDYEKAIKNYGKAIALTPTSGENIIKLGNMYRDKMDYDNALKTYQTAVDANPNDTEGFYRSGDLYSLYMRTRNYNKAIEQYSKAIAKDSVWAYFYIGLAYLSSKDYNKAIESLLFVVKHYKGHRLYLNPNRYMTNYSRPYMELGKAYDQQGKQLQGYVAYARGYLLDNNVAKSLEWLEKAAKSGYDISSDSFFKEDLKDNEQYKNLLTQYPKKD